MRICLPSKGTICIEIAGLAGVVCGERADCWGRRPPDPLQATALQPVLFMASGRVGRPQPRAEKNSCSPQASREKARLLPRPPWGRAPMSPGLSVMPVLKGRESFPVGSDEDAYLMWRRSRETAPGRLHLACLQTTRQ